MIQAGPNLGDRKVSQIFYQICLIFISALAILHYQRDFSQSEGHLNPIAIPSHLLQHFVLGYKQLPADLLWLRVIQDMDLKESKSISRGWVFNMMDGITSLDNRYRVVYREGAVVLSVLVHDKEGAAEIYERGVKAFPNDWEIAYRAGYHYLYEMKDCKRAAEYFNRAADDGAPGWVHSLASRLYVKSGQYLIARSILEKSIQDSKEDRYKEDFETRLRQLETSYNDPSNKTMITGLNCEVH